MVPSSGGSLRGEVGERGETWPELSMMEVCGPVKMQAMCGGGGVCG